MRKLSAAGSWLLLLGLGLLILGTEEHIRRQAGLFKTAQAQERRRKLRGVIMSCMKISGKIWNIFRFPSGKRKTYPLLMRTAGFSSVPMAEHAAMRERI